MLININGWISKIPFIKKIYSRILNIILNSKKEFIVNFKNIRLFINIKDPIDKIIFFKNEYEEKQIKFLSDWTKKNKPNIFIDIGANFALTVSGAHLNIPIAHIQGGEVTGSIDESLRHAMSKFSNYHLVANNDAKKRLIKMGERRENIFNVGCPSLDALFLEKKIFCKL